MDPRGNFDAVVFDMDGLLVDTEVLARLTWQRAAVDCGFELDDELFSSLVGRTRRDSNEVLAAAWGDAFSVDLFRSRCAAHWELELAGGAGIALKAGATELLDLLDEREIPRAVATSTTSEGAVRSLTLAGVLDRLPVRVTGDQVERGKPAPDIFLLAAERLGVAPRNCLVLEDSPNGIRAAHAAGMTPVMIPDLVRPTEEISRLAYRVVPSLHDVRELLMATRAGRVW